MFSNVSSYITLGYWGNGSTSPSENDKTSKTQEKAQEILKPDESTSTSSIKISNNNNIKSSLHDSDFELMEPNPKYECSIIPTLHCADTAEWRKELVKAAKHNIVISGNYCGGKSFDELLDLIAERMKQVPGLKVVIISHDKFILDRPNQKKDPYANLQKIRQIQEEYPNRFKLVESPDSYYGLKKVTNHTKCTVIDYGKYFIQGGSGIKDNFVLTGEDQLTVEDFKNQEKWVEINHQLLINDFQPSRLASMGKGSELEEDVLDEGLLGKLIPGNFRDQDFVFEDTSKGQEAGKLMFREALFLAYKWDYFQKNKRYLPAETWNIDELANQNIPAPVIRQFPALTDNIDEKAEKNESSALFSLLETKVPNLDSIDTKVWRFDRSPRKADNVATKFFFTGPEDSVSPFHQEIVDTVKEAKENIVIDQMYFHPTTELMNELINAAKRGVKITIITAGVTKDCPNGQLFFGPRNEYNAYYLVSSLTPEERKNVDVYLFTQKKKGLHKKVMIVDDKMLAGSSNLGYKSLVLMGDHEMNFVAESKEFVKKTAEEVILRDIELSEKMSNPDIMGWSKWFTAMSHSFGSRIWG